MLLHYYIIIYFLLTVTMTMLAVIFTVDSYCLLRVMLTNSITIIVNSHNCIASNFTVILTPFFVNFYTLYLLAFNHFDYQTEIVC